MSLKLKLLQLVIFFSATGLCFYLFDGWLELISFLTTAVILDITFDKFNKRVTEWK